MNDQPSDPIPPIPALPMAIPGFWRRSFAFDIDLLVVGAPSLLVAWGLYPGIVANPVWLRLIPFIFGLAYFGVCDSHLAHGQTLGKRWMGMAVVSTAGNFLSPGSAVLRALLVIGPLCLRGLSGDWHFNVVTGFIVFTLLGGDIFLLIFNRPSRQTVHDLAVASIVVRQGVHLPIWAPLSPWRWGIIGLIGLLGTYLSSGVTHSPMLSLMPSEFQAELPKVGESLAEVPGIRNYQLGFERENATAKPQRDYVVVTVVMQRKPENPQEIGRTVAQLMLNRHPRLIGTKYLAVDVVHGFDLGIASFSSSSRSITSAALWPTVYKDKLP